MAVHSGFWGHTSNSMCPTLKTCSTGSKL